MNHVFVFVGSYPSDIPFSVSNGCGSTTQLALRKTSLESLCLGAQTGRILPWNMCKTLREIYMYICIYIYIVYIYILCVYIYIYTATPSKGRTKQSCRYRFNVFFSYLLGGVLYPYDNVVPCSTVVSQVGT